MGKDTGEACGVSCIRAESHHSASSLKASSPPEAPPPNTIPLGSGFQHVTLGDTNGPEEHCRPSAGRSAGKGQYETSHFLCFLSENTLALITYGITSATQGPGWSLELQPLIPALSLRAGGLLSPYGRSPTASGRYSHPPSSRRFACKGSGPQSCSHHISPALCAP